MRRRSSTAAGSFAAFLGVAGVSHFLVPHYVRSLVPPWVPRPDAVVALSGLAEILVSILLARRPTRELGARLAATLISLYLVAHVDAARTSDRRAPRWLERPSGVTVRLAANLVYIACATAIARQERARRST